MADYEEPIVDEEPVYEEEEQFEEDVEEDEIVGGTANEVKLFGKWSFEDIEIRDISLVVSPIYVQFSS